MAETILPQGLRFFNKKATQPDFVIGALVITLDDLQAFCIDNPGLMTEYNGKKQLRCQVLKSREGNLYASVDTWKPAESAPSATDKLQQPVADVPDTGSLPF